MIAPSARINATLCCRSQWNTPTLMARNIAAPLLLAATAVFRPASSSAPGSSDKRS
jgi:hypothetical protein